MHPIERLRYVARATGAPADEIVQEAAASLAAFADDPVSLVTACRRLIDRHPANGPIWWLCARVLRAPDPADEAWRCQSEHHSDPTVRELGHALPVDAAVALVGWPERLGPALASRGDLEVRVIDLAGDGPGFARLLERMDVVTCDIACEGLAPAVAGAQVALIEALVVGPEVTVAAPGSWSVAAVARAAGVPVWLVAGRGRMVPAGLWPPLMARLWAQDRPGWEQGVDLVPLGLVDRVAGADGLMTVAEALGSVDTPDVAELRR